jgi:hypothetical protein
LLMGLVLLNYLLSRNGHSGPLSWLFSELYSWWGSVLGV